MILDIEPVRDGEDNKVERSGNDSSMSMTLIVIFALVFLIACGTSFGIGYTVGHYFTPPSSDKPQVETAAAKPNPAAALPLAAAGATQGSVAAINSDDKKSGLTKPPVAAPVVPVPTAQAPAVTAKAATSQGKPTAAQVTQAKPAAASKAKHSPSHSTEVAHNNNTAHGANPFNHMVSNPNYGLDNSPSHQPMVQVAVLTREEDASVLVDALSRHGYSASTDHTPDHRIHVRLGPFSSRSDASAMRDKLLNDGYNAVVQ
jgi:cell division protein FtsN